MSSGLGLRPPSLPPAMIVQRHLEDVKEKAQSYLIPCHHPPLPLRYGAWMSALVPQGMSPTLPHPFSSTQPPPTLVPYPPASLPDSVCKSAP